MPKGKKGRGRPRAFDREAVLDRAMLLFWEQGYEGTSLDNLTAAMGISTSSLYATFGDKERLFEEAIERYLAGPGGYPARILNEGETAHAAFGRLLEAMSKELTRKGRPLGCMVSLAVVQSSASAAPVKALLARYRTGARRVLQERLERGIASGDLRQGTDARALARFLMSVIQGMGVQARDGASREELGEIGRLALQVLDAAGAGSATSRPTASMRARARRL